MNKYSGSFTCRFDYFLSYVLHISSPKKKKDCIVNIKATHLIKQYVITALRQWNGKMVYSASLIIIANPSPSPETITFSEGRSVVKGLAKCCLSAVEG